MTLVNKILEYMPDAEIVNVNRHCRSVARNRAARVLQRAYRQWLIGKDMCDIRTYIKKYIPMIFRESFRNNLAIAVTITKCNTLAYVWMLESHRLKSLNQELTTEDLKDVYIRAARFVDTYRREIYDMVIGIIDQNIEGVKRCISNNFDLYVESRVVIRRFIRDNNGPADKPTIDDILFNIQESITMHFFKEISNVINTMDIYELVDIACDSDIEYLVMPL